MEAVCHTLEGALEKAIEQEQKSFEIYQRALKIVKNPSARKLLKELALEELEHKHALERALAGETVGLHEQGEKAGPTMNLTLFVEERPLDENASPQDALAFAMHDEKRSVNFYQEMATQCSGAPMEEIFSKFHKEETNHLARLEETYEKLFMSQM
ncbi:MAG: ferritin family protein [Thermodesulfobacteriota bacterium]